MPINNKKKLLIINGSGASIEFGMPSVNQIDSLFEQWSLPIYPLVDDPQKSLYTWVKDRISERIASNKNIWEERVLNFENILYTFQVLDSVLSDAQYGNYSNRLVPFLEQITQVDIKHFGKDKVSEAIDYTILRRILIDELLLHFRKLCLQLKINYQSSLDKVSNFYNDLQQEFEIGIINLNYDNVVMTACPNLETGFNKITGEFRRDILHATQWNFCYHLHGSVHFDLKNDPIRLHKIYWNPDLNSKFNMNSGTKSSNHTTEGIFHKDSPIIVGLDKINQINNEPFGSYFMQLDRLIYEADSILFIGYGFGDTYLNNLFPYIRSDSKVRKIAIVDYASDDEDGLEFRHDDWSFGLFTTIPYNSHEMDDGISRIPQPAIHFKSKNIFEKSSNKNFPLAVWYNGLLKITETTDLLIKELV